MKRAVAPDQQHCEDLAFGVWPTRGDLRELRVDGHQFGHGIALVHKGRVLILVCGFQEFGELVIAPARRLGVWRTVLRAALWWRCLSWSLDNRELQRGSCRGCLRPLSFTPGGVPNWRSQLTLPREAAAASVGPARLRMYQRHGRERGTLRRLFS